MKKILLVAGAIGLIVYFAGCSKSSPGYASCSGTAVADDSTALLSFAKKNSIIPSKDSSGLYYQIIDSGTGVNPTLSSTISVTYTGTLLDGTIFDSTTNSANTNFALGGLIAGWQIGVPKIRTGGRIKLLLPSALAYGCQGAGTTIPPNTPIFFDITLVSVK